MLKVQYFLNEFEKWKGKSGLHIHLKLCMHDHCFEHLNFYLWDTWREKRNEKERFNWTYRRSLLDHVFIHEMNAFGDLFKHVDHNNPLYIYYTEKKVTLQ